MSRARGRVLAVALASAALAAAVAAPGAAAHVQVVKKHPSGSATTSLRSVWVLFSGPIRGGTLVVKRVSSGRKVSRGRGGRDPRNVDRLLVPLKSGLKPGRYRAHASVVAGDGHHEEWTFRFRLRR